MSSPQQVPLGSDQPYPLCPVLAQVINSWLFHITKFCGSLMLP